ncbi:MAG: UDP-N-acetylmuramoyl-tripeptide--D-alanyl-D-alanine ligase [Alphaproteobacteria bacterium]|nr:UDP-N-acetylmuramoyl-tripeptide--D-alanyl-D-alanine ligase [Alphaproteobacteria bacterium]
MQKVSSKKLCEIVDSASVVVDVDIENIVSDSRAVNKGDLFVAIKGEKNDGHDYVAEVLKKGAAMAVVEHLVENAPADRQIVVENAIKAYGKIGAYNRSLYKGVVIGLTGSAGKTTTKEEVKFALSKFGKVYATNGNFNNHIGVPATLCKIDMDADYVVVEMGMSAKGEIEELVSYVQPDVAIITNVYPMHIEFFENFEGIAEAKAEIFKSIKKGGLAIINEDTNFAQILKKRAEENGAKVVGFGKNNHPNVELKLADCGEHNYYNAWCVLSLIKALGLDVNATAEHLSLFNALPGRGAKYDLKLPKGGEYTLIDDSYSGQPEAMIIAIETLDKMPHSGRKIVVLGKMAELGKTSKARHIEVGQVVAKSSIDVVVAVCPEMKDMLAQLDASKETHYFENKDGLDEFLINNLLQNNDIVLIKGARYSSKLYQVTDALLEKGKK